MRILINSGVLKDTFLNNGIIAQWGVLQGTSTNSWDTCKVVGTFPITFNGPWTILVSGIFCAGATGAFYACRAIDATTVEAYYNRPDNYQGAYYMYYICLGP